MRGDYTCDFRHESRTYLTLELYASDLTDASDEASKVLHGLQSAGVALPDTVIECF